MASYFQLSGLLTHIWSVHVKKALYRCRQFASQKKKRDAKIGLIASQEKLKMYPIASQKKWKIGPIASRTFSFPLLPDLGLAAPLEAQVWLKRLKLNDRHTNMLALSGNSNLLWQYRAKFFLLLYGCSAQSQDPILRVGKWLVDVTSFCRARSAFPVRRKYANGT